MEQIKYDLIIVGGGPAGLMAARVAGENGLRTALFERKNEISRVTRVDGGILSPVNEYLFGQILTFSPQVKRIAFPVCGFSVPYDGPYRNVYGFSLYSPGGKKIVFGDREKQMEDPEKNRMGVSIEKEVLLQGMLEDVRRSGVDIFSGVNVTDIEKNNDMLKITANGKIYESVFVIAADGVNSRIARVWGMNKERKFFATHQQYAWHLEGIDIPEVEGIAFIFTTYGTFYITTGCLANHYHVGVSVYKPTDNLKSQLDKFVYEDPVYSRWFKGGKKVSEYSCVVNMLAPMEEPFKDNILFIGDAAWLMEISNAAAICCGWKAANAITLAFSDQKVNKEGVKSYLEWWKQYFYTPYGEVEFKPIELQDFLDAQSLDYLASLIKEPLTPTMDFYKLINTIGETYGELFPVIQEERPEVMDSLMNIVNSMEEAEQEVKKAGFPNR